MSLVQKAEIGKDAEFLVDAMAQSIALDVFTMKLLKYYSGDHCYDFTDIDKKMESDTSLKKWNDFYTFWLGINWDPGIYAIKEELVNYLTISDVLEEKVEEDFCEGEQFRIDYISIDKLKYHFDYENETIVGKAEADYRLVITGLEGDEFSYGYVDTGEDYYETVSISFELKQGTCLDDLKIVDVFTDGGISTTRGAN